MILKYGSYAHDDNECSVVISARTVFNEVGVKAGYVERWDVRGIKHGADAAAVKTAIEAMRAAYSTNGRDLILYDSDGSTIRHEMRNSGSRRGVRVTDFAYPEGEGAEYTTYRTFTLSVETEYETDLGVYARNEGYEFSGGGPQRVVIPTLIGPPIEQLVRQQTPYRCVQSGSAIGVSAWPTPSSPAFPSAEHADQRVIRYESPREFGPYGNRMYPVSWTYIFESVSPIFAFPPG